MDTPVLPAPASQPWRAVFFDVENSSRFEHIQHVLDQLDLGTLGRETELTALGNWRVIGQDAARLLAARGARLVHTAPAFGVKDWSDLRIAVSAGAWLATARPGDVLEIITDDQAFDAVGDLAATRGVTFHRLSYRALTGSKQGSGRPRGAAEPAPRRSRRGGRGRRRPQSSPGIRRVDRPAGAAEPHSAPAEQVLTVVRELIAASPEHVTTLDAVANGLQARGFRRPPGSLRLVTRLRQMRELEVSTNGAVRLAGNGDSEPSGM
jgi:hypothetical protein